jgi:hypothetical protein
MNFSQQRERIFKATAAKQHSYASPMSQPNSLKSNASHRAFLDHHGDLVALRSGMARRIPQARHQTRRMPERPTRALSPRQIHGHGHTIPRHKDSQPPQPWHHTRRPPDGKNRIEDRSGKQVGDMVHERQHDKAQALRRATLKRLWQAIRVTVAKPPKITSKVLNWASGVAA